MVVTLMGVNGGSDLTSQSNIKVHFSIEKKQDTINGINLCRAPLRMSSRTMNKDNSTSDELTEAVNENLPIQPEDRDRENKQKESSPAKHSQAAINNQQLKDLLILQLDLIEHQQSKITDKDKQIISLKTEKEQLEARLGRMKRRIALQKRHSMETEELFPKIKLPVSTKSLAPIGTNKEVLKIDGPKVSSALPVTVTSRGDKGFHFNVYLKTNEAFLDLHETKLLPQLKAKSTTMEQNRTVSVPPWKIIERPIVSDEQEVEMEDIRNDAFLKRHMKPELDEKRRKRWDLQHLRQQRQHEMLVQKYNQRESKGNLKIKSSTSQTDACLGSLCRRPGNAMAIEVNNIVPVCAFGYEVPAVNTRELELPWFSVEKREIQLREVRQKLLKKQQQRRKSSRR